MPQDTIPSPEPGSVESLIIAYREASDPADRRLALRACFRRLQADAAILAHRLELLVVASAAEEGKS